MKTRLLTIALIVSAAAALAHSGVQNPVVLKRMDSMKTTADAMKVLGDMAKGRAPFDRDLARAAAAEVATQAALTPDLFAEQATDPKSEAKPEIWQNFTDFSAKSTALETVARDVSTSISETTDLPSALQQLGAACSACHKPYRE